MKLLNATFTIIVMTALFGVAVADDPMRKDMDDMNNDMMGHGSMMPYKKHHYQMMINERNQMKMDNMQMMKDLMIIVKNLNHKPSKNDVAKLDEMIGRMDEMIKYHEDMKNKMKGMYQDKDENSKK